MELKRHIWLKRIKKYYNASYQEALEILKKLLAQARLDKELREFIQEGEELRQKEEEEV